MDTKIYAVYWIYNNEYNSPMVEMVNAHDEPSAKIAAQRKIETYRTGGVSDFMKPHHESEKVDMSKVVIIGAVVI